MTVAQIKFAFAPNIPWTSPQLMRAARRRIDDRLVDLEVAEEAWRIRELVRDGIAIATAMHGVSQEVADRVQSILH